MTDSAYSMWWVGCLEVVDLPIWPLSFHRDYAVDMARIVRYVFGTHNHEESPRTQEDGPLPPPPSYELNMTNSTPSATINSKVDFTWTTESTVAVEVEASHPEREASSSPIQPYIADQISIDPASFDPIRTQVKDAISEVIVEPSKPDPVATPSTRPSLKLHSNDLLSSAGARPQEIRMPAKRRGLAELSKLSAIDHSENPKPADLPTPSPVSSEDSYISNDGKSPNRPADTGPGALSSI